MAARHARRVDPGGAAGVARQDMGRVSPLRQSRGRLPFEAGGNRWKAWRCRASLAVTTSMER